ncbi:MAG: 4-hydroxy-tetrahydrodipicolinate reductase [Candidatus Woesearchaeota archaeon]
MNVAIIGYGRMGHMIESLTTQKGINVISTIDKFSKEAKFTEINEESMKDVDVAIDFTYPDSAIENMKQISSLGVNLVMGTTGWYDHMDEAKEIIQKAATGMIWSGNFSLGVNLFFKIIENTSKIMNNADDYDIFVHEFHHNQKADSPSGTALMIGERILKNISRKKKIVSEELKRKINPEEIHVSSTRSGNIPGTHMVGFDSIADTIEIKHTARTREGFALGAIKAAEFIKGKKGFYNIDDLMKEIISS